MILALGVLGCTAPAPVARGATCYGITSENLLIRFETGNPASLQTAGVIDGLGSGETIRGMDVRPGGVLYVLTRTAAGLGRLYTVNPNTALATLHSTTDQNLGGILNGIDFDPVGGQLRVLGSDASNMRVQPESGAVTVDSVLHYTVGDPNAGVFPTIFTAAYTRDPGGGAPASLYAIDNGTDALVQVNPDSGGVMQTVGPLGLDLGGGVGFDIAHSPTNHGYAAIETGFQTTSLYMINLQNGHASLVGEIGVDLTLRAFALAPNYPQSGYSLQQTVRVLSTGSGYQLLSYNYTTSELVVTPYSTTTANTSRLFSYVEWTGAFLYDYDTARFRDAVYMFHDPL